MTPSSSLDKAVLAAVKKGKSKAIYIAVEVLFAPVAPKRFTQFQLEHSLGRLRRQGAIRFDRRKGWTPA